MGEGGEERQSFLFRALGNSGSAENEVNGRQQEFEVRIENQVRSGFSAKTVGFLAD
jgi:hypothetical protein